MIMLVYQARPYLTFGIVRISIVHVYLHVRTTRPLNHVAAILRVPWVPSCLLFCQTCCYGSVTKSVAMAIATKSVTMAIVINPVAMAIVTNLVAMGIATKPVAMTQVTKSQHLCVDIKFSQVSMLGKTIRSS